MQRSNSSGPTLEGWLTRSSSSSESQTYTLIPTKYRLARNSPPREVSIKTASAMATCPVAAKSSSPLKQCFYLIKIISDTYINTGRLCGERKFAATRGLHQKPIGKRGVFHGRDKHFSWRRQRFAMAMANVSHGHEKRKNRRKTRKNRPSEA